MTDAEKLAVAVAALEHIKAEACVCYFEPHSRCRCHAAWDAGTALDEISEPTVIIDEALYFEETGKLFPPGVTTREEAERHE